MIGMAKELIHTPDNDSRYQEVYNRLEKYEDISDRMEIEIGKFLNRVAEGRLSPEGKMRIAGMLRIISEIESIADGCFNVAKTLTRKNQNHVEFTPSMFKEIDIMFSLVDGAMCNMTELLTQMETPEDSKIFNINHQAYDYQQGIFYMDLVGEAEKLGDYMLNVVEGVKHQFKADGIS